MKVLLAAALLVLDGSQAAAGQGLSFLRPQTILIGDHCCSVLTGDFNRDGKTDIAVAHSVSGITVLLGDGKGGFTRVETAQGPAPGMLITGLIAAADLNSDGILDIIAISETGGEDSVSIELLGRGDGTFQPPVVLGGDIVEAVGDLNGDGRPDLLVRQGSNSISQGFAVRFGNGDGTFQPNGPFTPFPSGDFEWAAIADFNGDGKADVVQETFRPSDSHWIYVWLGNGDGTFRGREDVPLSNWGSRLAVADFNLDGKPDLVVSEISGPGTVNTEVLLGRGDGNFQTGKVYGSQGGAYVPLTVADFNGDGRPDVAAGFTVLLGKGDGSMEQPVAFGQFFNSQSGHLFNVNLVAVGDFNGDGKPDLVGAGLDGTQLSILINNTPGADNSANAVSAVNYTAPIAPGSIASVFGTNLAATTATATTLPLPTVLANTRVRIFDQNGVEWLGSLLFVSPSQINVVLPPETASGYAIFNVDNGISPTVDGARPTLIQSIAPGFFTADASGHGPPAATAVRVHSDGTRTPVIVFQCSSADSCAAFPIDLSAEGTVYLSLYGTGFAKATLAACATVPIGLGPSLNLPVLYSGPQGGFAGLDQLNLELSRNIPSGTVEIGCGFQNANDSGSAHFTIVVK